MLSTAVQCVGRLERRGVWGWWLGATWRGPRDDLSDGSERFATCHLSCAKHGSLQIASWSAYHSYTNSTNQTKRIKCYYNIEIFHIFIELSL